MDIFLIQLYYLHSKKKIFQEFSPIRQGIFSIGEGQEHYIEEDVELVEIKQTINRASRYMTQIKDQRHQWLRGISHDIRTPLSKIQWSTLTLASQLPENFHLKKIQEEINRINNMIQDLNFTIALEENNYYDSFQRENILGLMRKLIAKASDSNPEYSFEFYNLLPTPMYLLINRHLMERAVENILRNSILHNDPCKIAIYLERMGDLISITIEDSGKGVDSETLARLNRNYRKEDTGIHGLGLLVVKQIIAIHRGKIEFSNGSLGGLQVNIQLPLPKN
ncbi:MAG: HAMP domain-containing sensor histidine kinase [Tissierellia bacterium]|nr:HAMP domain-containing sensor histidine kinase [Tissierellia bacterium]